MIGLSRHHPYAKPPAAIKKKSTTSKPIKTVLQLFNKDRISIAEISITNKSNPLAFCYNQVGIAGVLYKVSFLNRTIVPIRHLSSVIELSEEMPFKVATDDHDMVCFMFSKGVKTVTISSGSKSTEYYLRKSKNSEIHIPYLQSTREVETIPIDVPEFN